MMGSKKNRHLNEIMPFPKGFLWGSATSAHQVEGGNINSDWWAWEQTSGKEPSGKAVNHYHLYEEDFDLVKKFNQNAHRLSIEWARLEPNEGQWDLKEIEHYHQVFKALKKRKVKIMLTLSHFTLPIWVARSGGWENKKTIARFGEFVTVVLKEYGQLIDFWITINEPSIYASMSYVSGDWPPNKKGYFRAWLVFKNLMKAHNNAYRAIHKKCGAQAMVGIANNIISITTYGTDSFLNYLYVRVIDLLWNHLTYYFTRGRHDFIGINYYFHQRLEREKGQLFGIFVDVTQEKREYSDMGWEVYPQGIFEVANHLKKYNLPIYITENGIAALNDDKRVRFIVAHLKELYHAIQAGADVRGYFYWSLLDNFEWDKGFGPCFGLVGVSHNTYSRHPHRSADVYAKIAKQNAILHDDLVYLGHHQTHDDLSGN